MAMRCLLFGLLVFLGGEVFSQGQDAAKLRTDPFKRADEFFKHKPKYRNDPHDNYIHTDIQSVKTFPNDSVSTYHKFDCEGVFQTLDDYSNQKITCQEMFNAFESFNVIFTNKGQKIKYSYSGNNIWGIFAGNELYRMSKKYGAAFSVIENGKICLYGKATYVTAFRNNNGKVFGLYLRDPRQDLTMFSSEHYVNKLKLSEGLNGNLADFTEENLKKLIKDDETILDEMKKNPLKKLSEKEKVTQIYYWVHQYNLNHK